MDKRRTTKMLEYFQSFQLTDLLAFGNILGVEEKEDFQDYITEIMVSFNNQNRIKRKQLLNLAREVKLANKDIERGGVVWPKNSKESLNKE